MTGGVERVLRWVFILALSIAAPLLLAGLLTGSPRLLEAGVLTVMVTPLVGAVIVAMAMALRAGLAVHRRGAAGARDPLLEPVRGDADAGAHRASRRPRAAVVIPPRSRIEAVLFDWDGTLVDSAEASFRCYESTFGSYGIRFDRDTYAATYSPNWHRTYTAVGLPADRWDEADARWIEGYCRLEIPLLPGAREAIERLAAAGLAQAIVTSGDRTRVKGELERHGLARYFPVMVCGSDGMAKKPHPEALLAALSRMSIPPGRAVYVGDSPEDVEMARQAGAASVGDPGRIPQRGRARASRPDLLAASLADAVDALIGPSQAGSAG